MAEKGGTSGTAEWRRRGKGWDEGPHKGGQRTEHSMAVPLSLFLPHKGPWNLLVARSLVCYEPVLPLRSPFPSLWSLRSLLSFTYERSSFRSTRRDRRELVSEGKAWVERESFISLIIFYFGKGTALHDQPSRRPLALPSFAWASCPLGWSCDKRAPGPWSLWSLRALTPQAFIILFLALCNLLCSSILCNAFHSHTRG